MIPLGIDLGSCFCRAFVAKGGGTPVPVVGVDGAFMPSVMTCLPEGRILAGAEAVVAATSRGLPLLRGIPRVLGRRYYSPETDWLKHGFAGEVVPSPHGDTWLRLHGVEPDQHQEVAPEQLVGALLREIMAAAERAIGRRPTTVVIAVPNAFDQLQRRALVAAARLAEVPLHSLVQSSAAFALAMPPSQGVARAAVVDFGGGYLDVALVEQQHAGRGWEVTAADGDGLLGGLDFDRRVVGLLPPDGQETPLPVLMDRAAQLRHALTQSDRAMWGGERSAAAVSRAQHDEVVADELAAIGPTCGQVFADVELGTDDVEELVLTGGLAAVPAVQRTVAELFRQMPVRLDGAQDFPALGALRAAQGRRASQRSTRTIGVKVRGGMMSPIIARGRALPWEAAINFGAPAPGQQRIVFEVYEGDAMEAAQNLYLGSFVLEGVAPGHSPRVTFSLDKNGTFRAGNWTTGFTNGQAVFHWAGGFPSDRGLEIAAVDDDYARVPQSASSAVQESEDPTTLLVRRAPRSEHSHIRPSTRPPPPSDQPSPLPSEDPVLGTVVGGRYQIDELIAEGGMGRVYRATHTTLGRRFAVKILHPELAQNDDLAMRFLREAQAAARIESDHVVDIVDFGRLDDGTGYFVMEHLDGKTLGELIKEKGRLDEALTREIGRQVAHGVAAAHAIDIVHRDLKPDNIAIVKRPGRDFLPKILDFGIAKHPTSSSDGPITMAGSLVGSPYYMAPEQIVGGTIDARTDIYALGIMLFEMLTGAPPYLADSVAHVLQQHMEAEPPTIQERGGACSADLESVIRRCLAKKPEDRYPSAQALIAELAQAS